MSCVKTILLAQGRAVGTALNKMKPLIDGCVRVQCAYYARQFLTRMEPINKMATSCRTDAGRVHACTV